ncbi:hypothetical protein KJ059_14655 [Myxococcota bacterium]|nr:hypothetical protein [Myxococcota bacterium]MCZ7618913.1 DUF6531 domain-containing protein [Myxococcota bacterium]
MNRRLPLLVLSWLWVVGIVATPVSAHAGPKDQVYAAPGVAEEGTETNDNSEACNADDTSELPDCDEATCQGTDEGTNPESPASQCSTPSPVDLATGREIHAKTDLVVKGVYPIRVRRVYDSASVYDSVVGYGWSLTSDIRLFRFDDGTVMVRHPGGRRDRYVFTGGAWVYDGPRLHRLQLTGDADAGFELRQPGGYVAEFGIPAGFTKAPGLLTALRDPQGNRLRFTYSASRHDLWGTSPYANDKSQPMVVASTYRLETVVEVLADDTGTGRSVSFAYDPESGRLASVTSYDGRTVTYGHEPPEAGYPQNLTNGNLGQVTGLEGIVSSYEYQDPEDSHNLTHIQEGQGTATVVNTYDPNGRVVSQTRGSRLHEFVYGTAVSGNAQTTWHQRITDPRDSSTVTATTVYEFDPSGYPLRTTDPEGHVVVYQRYDGVDGGGEAPPDIPANGAIGYVQNVIVLRNEGSLVEERRIQLTWDADGNRTSRAVTLAGGETVTESWTYDGTWVASAQTVSSADPGKLFRTEYTFYRGGLAPGDPGYSASDPITNIREIKRRRDDGSFATTTLSYNGYGQLSAIELPDGHRIVRTFYGPTDPQPGLVQRVSHEVGGVEDAHLRVLYDYDAAGNVQAVTDAKGNATLVTWDALGRVQGVENARGEKTLYTYRASGAVPTDPGHLLHLVERGRTVAEGEGRVMRLVYSAEGHLQAVLRKDGGGAFVPFASFVNDSEGRRLEATDAVSRTTAYAYDRIGQRTAVTDAAASPNTTTFAYDAAGNRTRVTDALARDTVFVHDALGRLREVRQEGVSPALVTRFAYDAARNVTKVTDPKDQETIYLYDALSRLTGVTQPLGQTVSYAYDARDRLETVTNARGHVLHHTYFPWGGLEQVVHDLDGDGPEPGEREIAYGYDLNGNVTAVSDSELGAGPLYGFTHDPLDRVDTVTAHVLPGAPVLDSGYDRFGERASLALADGGPGSPLAHAWAFDALGRLEAATLPGSASPLGFDHFANDDLRQITHGNGLVTDLTYHPEGPLQSIKVGSTPLHELVYTVDPVLNVDTITETIAGTPRSPAYAYGYDGVSRLTSAIYPMGLGLPASESFPYDAAGNRDDDPDNPTPWAYDANNRTTASPGTAVWCHDADGNLASKRTGGDCTTGPVAETFTFDAANRLRTWTDGTTTASYAYDPFGRRIQRTVGGATTWSLWDGDRLLAEYDATGDRTARYAYAGGWAPIQYATPDGASGEDVYDVHADHLDTPKLLTDSSGSAVWRAAHEAFGLAALDPANTVTFNVRFPGQYFDAETGLHYNYFRTYDSDTGRYISADPIGQSGGSNLYSYAGADPSNRIDPTGQIEDSVTAKCKAGSPSACAVLGLPPLAGGAGLGAAQGTVNLMSPPREKSPPRDKCPPEPVEEGEVTEDTPPAELPQEVEEALDQLDDISAAQDAYRQGRRDRPIDFTDKSAQRARDALRRIRSTRDLE